MRYARVFEGFSYNKRKYENPGTTGPVLYLKGTTLKIMPHLFGSISVPDLTILRME